MLRLTYLLKCYFQHCFEQLNLNLVHFHCVVLGAETEVYFTGDSKNVHYVILLSQRYKTQKCSLYCHSKQREANAHIL